MTSLIFCGEWGTIVLYGPSYGHAKTNQSLYPLFHIDVNIQGNRLENSVSPMLMALGTSYMDVRKMTVSKPSGKNRANIPLLLNCAAFVSQGCIAAVAKIRMAKKILHPAFKKRDNYLWWRLIPGKKQRAFG